MANQQHKQPQTKTPQKAKRRSPSQICASPSSRETKQNSKRGRAQQKQPRTRICHGHSGESHCVATHKKMHQTNWLLPRKVKHAFLIVVADRQQRKALAVHHCVLASQSPLTGSCSGVQSKTKWICRVLNGVFRSRESVLLAARLLLYRPPCGEQLRGSGKDSHIRQGRWPVVVRHFVTG